MPLTVLTNAFLIDGTGKEPVDGAAVVVEGERIKDVIRSGKVGPLRGKVDTLDLRGRTLMPGLTDAHVHVCAVEGNTAEQHRHNPPSLIAAKTLRRIEQALQQGFTTIRDAGGADYGFREAVGSGMYPGPRMLVSGRVLSQTGGHGDKRRRAELVDPVDCCLGMVGVIADGPDEVRKATREQLRRDVPSTPWKRCAPPSRRRARWGNTCWPTPTRARRCARPSRPACAASSTGT